MPVLYRGIAVREQTADADRAAIRQTGNLAAKAWWKNTMASPPQVRSRISELTRAPSKVRDKIGKLPQMPLTHACGDFGGAARYALRESGIPVVITFEIAFEEVIIGGKDFLYTVFQLWDREGPATRPVCGRTFRPCRTCDAGLVSTALAGRPTQWRGSACAISLYMTLRRSSSTTPTGPTSPVVTHFPLVLRLAGKPQSGGNPGHTASGRSPAGPVTHHYPARGAVGAIGPGFSP